MAGIETGKGIKTGKHKSEWGAQVYPRVGSPTWQDLLGLDTLVGE